MRDFQRELTNWFNARIPDDWFSKPVDITCDRDEILVIGALPLADQPPGTNPEQTESCRIARIDAFREDTRDQRTDIAGDAERQFDRKVSWGVICGGRRKLFTNQSIPVMTRLRMPERLTLDTLIDSGVARSRSDALSWCVRLVSQHEAEWLADLREALIRVEEVRSTGPDPDDDE